jgi:hypothetical protein
MVKSENPGMWINPKSDLHGGNRRTSYGEGQNSHNSRFLELADIALSPKNPEQQKATIAVDGEATLER